MLHKLVNRFPVLARYLDVLQPKTNQGHLDLYNASLLLLRYDWERAKLPQASLTEKDVEAFYDKVDGMTKSARDKFVREGVNRQVKALFEGLHAVKESHNVDNLQQIIPSSASLASNTLNVSNHTIGKYKHRIARSKEKEVPSTGTSSSSFLKEIGFELLPSSSPIHGTGVFLHTLDRKSILPGTVLGFFAGKVHPLEYLKGDYLERKLLPDPHFMLMTRTDGHIIDGRSADECSYNPYAIAQLVNHPPTGVSPNVMAVSDKIYNIFVFY